jgi:hypothetical protein
MNLTTYALIATTLFLATSCRKQIDPHSQLPTHAVDCRDTLRVGDTVDAANRRVYEITDTTLLFQKEGSLVAVIIDKRRVSEYQGFQEYLNAHKADSLFTRSVQLLDITGDGLQDSIIATISMVSDRPFITHEIFSQDRRIWYDTLGLDEELAMSLYWGGDGLSYLALKPFSAMFTAGRINAFDGGVIDTNSSEVPNFIYFHKGREEYWRQHLRGFKGRWIWELGEGADQFIWDEVTGKFVGFMGQE